MSWLLIQFNRTQSYLKMFFFISLKAYYLLGKIVPIFHIIAKHSIQLEILQLDSLNNQNAFLKFCFNIYTKFISCTFFRVFQFKIQFFSCPLGMTFLLILFFTEFFIATKTSQTDNTSINQNIFLVWVYAYCICEYFFSIQ